MPKSKRDRPVMLSETNKKGREHKAAIAVAIKSALDTYSSAYALTFENMPNLRFQEFRDHHKAISRCYWLLDKNLERIVLVHYRQTSEARGIANSDLTCHYFSKAGVSAIRRLRKTDNNRIAKACGAVIVNRPEELQESDVGTGAGLLEVKKFGDEFFSFIVDCKDP